MQELLKKLEAIHYRFVEVGTLIVDPDIISDMDRYVKLNKEYRDLEEIVAVYHEYKNVLDNLTSSKELLAVETDPEMREMAKMEIDELENKKPDLIVVRYWLPFMGPCLGTILRLVKKNKHTNA